MTNMVIWHIRGDIMKMIDYQKLANDDISNSTSTLNVHDHLKGKSVEDLRVLCDQDRLPFGVCILNVTGELNVGTIVRNALLTGARKVAIIGRRKYDKRGTVGSENYIDVERIDGFEDDGLTIDKDVFWSWIDDNDFAPVFCEQGGTLLPLVDWPKSIDQMAPRSPCLVFGNENRGVQDDILNDERGTIVSIPQRGVIRSYNVASASGIVMYSMTSGMKWL